MLVKLNLALAFETLVLIAALFLLIYINKNQLSKWYRYAGIAIVVFIMGLMLCSVAASCRMCGHKKMGGCEMSGMGKHKRMMCMSATMQGGCCEQMMQGCGNKMMGCGMGHGMGMGMHHGSCGMGMGSGCMMGSDKGHCGMDKEDCGMKNDDEKEECMKKCGKDSIIKKEVIIKK
ncbi:MAG: hypothetical protein HYU69_04615 [Bacteroidetes bacterium]|nr:hypothetical protein [Bacteroidota bacterium]